MLSSDDYGISDDDTDFVVVATQVEARNGGGFEASPRPSKRRRTGEDPCARDGSDESVPERDVGYCFPSVLGEDPTAVKQSKYRIHVPKNGGNLPNAFFTQTQVGLDEDPTAIRGAIWKKPAEKPNPPLINGAANGVSGPVTTAFSTRTLSATGLAKANNLDRYFRPPDRPLLEKTAVGPDVAVSHRPEGGQKVLPQQDPQENANATRVSFNHASGDFPSDDFPLSSQEMLDVIEVAAQSTQVQAAPRNLRAPQVGLKQMTISGQPATQAPTVSQAAKKKYAFPLKARDEPPTHHKLDEVALEKWIFPTNLGTFRDYQFNIVSRSLFSNTLVALPTGLGKTFIAATVMLNYYRWTTESHVLFMAPTKPLIAQQMEACYGIVGIPRRDTVLMTGETTPAVRMEEWSTKHVFFMTPQTVINDLKTGICDPKKIVLVVVDEAHKATGGYAYTEVVSFLRRFNNSFRVLALTATPGSTVEAVQAVIDHLGIARVELRTEESLDIRQYTHEKHTETEVFEYNEEQLLIIKHVSKAIQPVLQKLCSQNAYWVREPIALTAYGLTQARKKWSASDAGRKAPMPVKGMINSVFTVLSQLAHGLSLLKNHGIGPFFSNLRAFHRTIEENKKAKNTYAKQIIESEDCVQAMRLMRTWSNNVDFIGHPKLQYLREVVMNHFLDAGEGRKDPLNPPRPTRIMVFATYRDSTEEICRVLKRNEPLVRPHVFVGQAASKGSEGMNQKTQQAVIQDFKSGKYNTLVATSIGEEGLDIGDVDLIICYDASSSPIRMLQRIGRTGRKRVGRVVLLLMSGKEAEDYNKAQHNYVAIQKSIAEDSRYDYRQDQSPRIIPKEINPAAEKRAIEIPVENSQPIDLNEKGRRAGGRAKAKRPPKKFHMPDGVRTGFVNASNLRSDGENEDCPAAKRKSAAKKKPTKSKSAPPPQIEVAQVPFLEDVILSEVQRRDHERRFARTSDLSENPVVEAPDLAHCTDSLRDLPQTKYVRHGRAAVRISQALQAVRDMDQTAIERLESVRRPFETELQIAVRARLVDAGPAAGFSEPDRELQTRSKSPPKPKRKRGPGRARKKQVARRSSSPGSAAMEGDESSPGPTPADMRIGTQGIDLGSRDTSGEDEDEGADSELDGFVVGSDQPIEMASSSLPRSQNTHAPLKRGRGLLRKPARATVAIDEDEEGDDGREEALVHSASEVLSEQSGAEGLAEDAARKARKRRVLDDSESET